MFPRILISDVTKQFHFEDLLFYHGLIMLRLCIKI